MCRLATHTAPQHAWRRVEAWTHNACKQLGKGARRLAEADATRAVHAFLSNAAWSLPPVGEQGMSWMEILAAMHNRHYSVSPQRKVHEKPEILAAQVRRLRRIARVTVLLTHGCGYGAMLFQADRTPGRRL